MLDEIYHAISPVAFSIGPVDVRWYGLAYLAGFFFAALVIYRVARRWKLPMSLDDIFVLIVFIAFGVIIGARTAYVLFYNLDYYLANPTHILMFNEGGMSFHGGFVGAVLGGFIACRYLKLSFVTMCDLDAIAAPIGLFFGRCANFINGELWGKPTDLPWGVTFESGGGVPRHPSQLYEALLEGVVLFCILFAMSYHKPTFPQGTFIGLFMMFYGVFRFLIEFVRVPDAQLGYLFGPVTMGQLLSLPLVVGGIAVLVIAKRKNLPQRLHAAPCD